MERVKVISQRIVVRFLTRVLLLFLSGLAWTQAQDQPEQATTQQQENQGQSQKQSDKSVRPTQATPGEEAKLRPRERKGRLPSAAEILPSESNHTGLPLKKKLNRHLTGVPEVSVN